MIIQIAHEVSDEKFQKVEDFLQKSSLSDVNFNGEDFELERGDFTQIPEEDSISARQLFVSIQNIIQ